MHGRWGLGGTSGKGGTLEQDGRREVGDKPGPCEQWGNISFWSGRLESDGLYMTWVQGDKVLVMEHRQGLVRCGELVQVMGDMKGQEMGDMMGQEMGDTLGQVLGDKMGLALDDRMAQAKEDKVQGMDDELGQGANYQLSCHGCRMSFQ